jgi:hypothetical protein
VPHRWSKIYYIYTYLLTLQLQSKQTVETINATTALSNLVATLAHHQQLQLESPMQTYDIEQNARIIRDLNSTLKTIIRI